MKNKRAALIVLAIILGLPPGSWGLCQKGGFLDPVNDVCWECMYPIKLMGQKVSNVFSNGGSVDYTVDDTPVDPANTIQPCVCVLPGTPPVIQPGLPTSLWEPSHIIETVADPYCLPTLGTQMNPPTSAAHGSTSGGPSDISTFAQVHVYTFPLNQILSGMLTGSCATMDMPLGLFDLAYISEPDPTHSDDAMSNLLNKESILFANPVAQISCMADSAAANVGAPIDAMFWCMGSWGSVYPLDGRMPDDRVLSSNAAIAAKNIYKRLRTAQSMDVASDPTLCGPVATPTWVKSHYRLQPALPVRGYQCSPIGRSALIWGVGVNPAFSGNNFAWIQFRKKACCAW